MPTPPDVNGSVESLVACRNSQGIDLHATLIKLSRFQASFEVYGPVGTLRLSEVLEDFKIFIQGRPVYAGRAIVSNLIHVGAVSVCETTLDEACLDLTTLCQVNDPVTLRNGFEEFVREWSKSYKVLPEFKVVMADLQTLLLDLRLWMEQMELSVRSQPSGDRAKLEHDVLETLQKSILPLAAPLLEKFEILADGIDRDLRPAHRAYMKRQIHPVVLCSPFLYRTFQKPLGYAGDYEMVNMMVRDPFEGASMFAKLMNRLFLYTSPVVAHQNRIVYLTQHLATETRRCLAQGRPCRVYNLGCGPAKEIQEFIANHDLSDHAQFTLLDFNEETLAYTSKVLGDLKTKHHRNTSVQLIKRSVHQVLKDAGKAGNGPKYDLVYCAGLFDYLSDQVCKKLMNYFYDLVAPGGLLLATNVSIFNPSRNWMEYVLDWHLIYRDTNQMEACTPLGATAENAKVYAIGDGVNLALEARKPL